MLTPTHGAGTGCKLSLLFCIDVQTLLYNVKKASGHWYGKESISQYIILKFRHPPVPSCLVRDVQPELNSTRIRKYIKFDPVTWFFNCMSLSKGYKSPKHTGGWESCVIHNQCCHISYGKDLQIFLIIPIFSVAFLHLPLGLALQILHKNTITNLSQFSKETK